MARLSYDVFFEELQDKLRREGGSYNPETGMYGIDDDPWAVSAETDRDYWANIARESAELDAERYLEFA